MPATIDLRPCPQFKEIAKLFNATGADTWDKLAHAMVCTVKERDSLQAELSEAYRRDDLKMKEYNLLVQENRNLLSQLAEAQKQLAAKDAEIQTMRSFLDASISDCKSRDAEIERLQRCCAEMRSVLEQFEWEDLFPYRAPAMKDWEHAISINCGKDYVHFKPQMELLVECAREALAFYRIVAYDPNMAQHRGLVEDAKRSIDRIEPILQTVTATLTTAHSPSPA